MRKIEIEIGIKTEMSDNELDEFIGEVSEEFRNNLLPGEELASNWKEGWDGTLESSIGH